MISAIEAALGHVKTVIPEEVLRIAFDTDNHPDESLDYLIKKEVILDRVKRDASIRGGKIMNIVLDMRWAHFTAAPSPYSSAVGGSYNAFLVPPEAREHRDIVAVIRVQYPFVKIDSTGNSWFSNYRTSGNTLHSLARSALDQQTWAFANVSPTAELRPSNIIILDPTQYNFIPWQITVRLEYDDEFTGMDVSAVNQFRLLCEYAVKMYIWNKLVVKIDTNAVFRGASIGVIKDLVSDYSNARDQYEEQLLALGGAEMFDMDRQRRLLLSLVPRK